MGFSKSISASIKFSLPILFLFLATCFLPNLVFATDDGEQCGERLANVTSENDMAKMIRVIVGEENKEASEDSSHIFLEKRALTDFLKADDENLVLRAPFTVMNAAQRILDLIYSQGVKKIKLPITGEEVDFYPFFSEGNAITNGKLIVGNEKVIAQVVNNIRAQAQGDRSAVSIPLLEGSHGTGKTELLKLLSIGVENLTAKSDSKFANYTYSWVRLGEIPSLHRFIPSTNEGGSRVYADLGSPLGDSPVVLFPPEIQKALIKKSTKTVQALVSMDPTPVLKLDPISFFIRSQIVQHYSEKRGHPLSANEIVEVLNDHVVVRRQVIGRTYGNMPLIEKQPDDLDIAGLFMTPNPVVRFASGEGPTHPMAWYFNGKILSGHGNAIQFDELLRNPPALRDMLLGVFESREVSVGGAQTVPFDPVILASTNSANIQEVKQQKNGTGDAILDRLTPMPMRWSALPSQIIQLLILGKQKETYQQPLKEGEEHPVTGGKIYDLVPRQEGLNRLVTSDYRYRIWFGSGADKVEVAPHTLLMMSEIIAASRMRTNPEKAAQVFQGKIVGSNLLINPIDRLRLYEGTRPDVTRDEIRELTEVTKLLKEGESGISARDAGKWLSNAIAAARGGRAGNTLTPGVALATFREMLTDEAISSPSNKVRLEWLGLADEVVAQMLIPRLDGDISKALANGEQVVKSAYWDILQEMWAISLNPEATTYISETGGQERPIDRERLAAIKEIYKQKNGRTLNEGQIAVFHANQKGLGIKEVGRVPDESLLDAIAQYYAKLTERVAGFGALIEFERTGIGNDDVKMAHTSLISALKAMGYNEVAVKDALMLINDQRSRNRIN